MTRGSQFADLLAYWKSEGIALTPGNDEQELSKFEHLNAVILPADLRDYYLAANGMPNVPGSDCDSNGFRFWPLSEVKPLHLVCEGNSVPLPAVDPGTKYFVFADFLQWSWAYAVDLSGGVGDHSVIHVGTLSPKTVARSFRHFVDLYLADDKRIYVAE